jgi:ATP-dependent DNA helicase RecG
MDIEKLIEQTEGQFLERKSCYDRSKGKIRLRSAREVARDISEVLSAFANADGGTLILGVEDNGEVTGVQYPSDKESILKNSAQQNIRPALKSKVEIVDCQGKKLWVFQQDWVPTVHQLSDGRYLYRIGESNVPFPADQIEAIKAAKRQATFEMRIIPTATMNDLDERLVREIIERLGIKDSMEEFLSRYRLLDWENGNPRLPLAGLLLFGKDPIRWHPRCGIDFVLYEGTERRYGREINIIKRARIEVPLIKIIDEAFQTIKPHVKERQVLHDLFFQERLEYPTFAWQEAIINAVAHRDYSLTGTSIEIWMFDDRIEVRSPGLPPAPVTIERLRKRERVHASRNPLMVRLFTDLGYMRETGEGIPRMFEEMERNGLHPPDISIEADSIFQVSLRNQPIYNEKDLEWLERYHHLKLKPEQKRALIFGHSHGDSLTSRQYQNICGVDIYQTSRDLKNLVKKGALAWPQKGGRVYMILEEPVPLLQNEKKILQTLFPIFNVFKQKDFLTNTDIRKAMKVSRIQASRIARELVDLGFLVKEGRGRGTRYIRPKTKNESSSN